MHLLRVALDDVGVPNPKEVRVKVTMLLERSQSG